MPTHLEDPTSRVRESLPAVESQPPAVDGTALSPASAQVPDADGSRVLPVPAPAHVSETRRIALVHDYLTQFGGAERVLEVLHEVFPEGRIFTSLVDRSALPPRVAAWDLHETWLARIPQASRVHRGLVPLYPAAFRGLADALAEVDVILADSSAWAHHVGVHAETVLICYCHSPARFLYGDRDYLAPARIPPILGHLASMVFAALRRTDRRAAARVDRYVANSRNVAARIRAIYGRDAAIVYPPVDVDRFAGPPIPAEPWYLVVSRLVPHKRIDLAVDVATRYRLPLKVIGDGRAYAQLRRRAGPTVEFLGRMDDAQVVDHYRRARALILPGAEDFGMTAVEAQAAGRPVIAYGAGGALESILPGETGILFGCQTVESLMASIEAFEARQWEAERCRANALRFGRERFLREIAAEVEAALESKELRRGSIALSAD
jgi:glycosyltransferase involved in cell wall biosynthesis